MSTTPAPAARAGAWRHGREEARLIRTINWLACYELGGVRFHRPIAPCQAEELSRAVPEVVDWGERLAEAKPQGTLRIKDAVAVLEQFLAFGTSSARTS
jgi:hypothetical protein